MSSQKNIKLTAAGQLALKNITIAPADRNFLEQFLVRTGYVLAVEEIVAIENEDVATTLSRLKGNGWIRETVLLTAASSINQPTVVQQDPSQSVTPPPVPVVEETSEKTSNQEELLPPAIPSPPLHPSFNVTEEEKARSFEQFMRVMASKN